jgi:hypothetical protein
LTSPRSLPTSPCELSEREITSPSNLKVVGALDNYSLVFVIFINFFGQLMFNASESFSDAKEELYKRGLKALFKM